jgi:hypothetical protein
MTITAQLTRNARLKTKIDQNSVSGAVRTFAYFISAGSLGVDTLAGHDYRPRLMAEPWLMEQLFAIFVNNLKFDETGKVTNRTSADRRAAEWLLTCFDQTYVPKVAFTDEERALY